MENNKTNKQEIKNKWSSLIEGISAENENKNWMEEYAEMHKMNENQTLTSENSTINEIDSFTSLLPLTMKIEAKTIGQHLIPVQPMSSSIGIPLDELERIISRIKQDNRSAKIDSLVEEREFIEKELENDDEYKELCEKYGCPEVTLMYFDYIYSGTDEK